MIGWNLNSGGMTMPKKKEPSHKNKKSARLLYWGTVSVLVLIIIACAGLITYKLVTDAQDKDYYEGLQTPVDEIAATEERPTIPPTTEPGETTVPTEPTQPTEPPQLNDTVLLKLQGMYALNKDMVGWIKIENTAINYPVVQTPDDPNFYLRRNFNKEDATCGTIFASGTCDINLPSDNVVLYGHNMRNGTMFADLLKYKSKTFWEEHRYVYFDTLTELHTYEIFAVFLTSADLTQGFTYHVYDTFETEADFNKYVSNCQNMMKRYIHYDTGITPQFMENGEKTKLLTLSTCDKSIDDGRLVVVARRVV